MLTQRLWGVAAFGALLLTASAPAHADEGLTVAVLNIAGESGDEALRGSLVDALAVELGKQPALKVITKNEIDSMLGLEKVRDAMGCSEVSCYAEIGGALGADRLLSGSLGHTDKPGQAAFYSLTLQWLDAKRGEVLRRESISWEGSAEGLYQQLPAVTLKLVYGSVAQDFVGKLVLTTTVEQAKVLVNGIERGRTPLVAPLTLPIGKVAVDVVADGYEPYRSLVVINRDATSSLVANLIEKPGSPFYGQWWFWTGAAVVVGGGVAAAILLGGGGSDNRLASGSVTVPPLPGIW